MAGKDIIEMSQKERKRLHTILNVLEGKIKQVDVAKVLGLTDRQIRRITKRVKEEGDKGVIHRSRGRPSNRAKPVKVKNRVLDLCRGRYKGFGPTLAAEKLLEIDKIEVDPETLRLWFIRDGIEYKKRKEVKHRSWRERKEHFGEMVQMDGSHHNWFEGRGAGCVLMGYIDDARGIFFGRFYGYEGTKPAMDSFKRYIRKYGIPQSVYLDKHTTYKSTKKTTIEEQLEGKKSQSQFERALGELGVEIIYADSPQAKGRIERSFKTHQDRLIKEMRLRKISTIEEANKFLRSYYIPKHNRKFSVSAKNKVNLHRPIPKGLNLGRIFSIKTEVSLRKDFTIRYGNKLYQVLAAVRVKKLVVEERLTGKLYVMHKDRALRYKLIDTKPIKPGIHRNKPKKAYIPPKDHPWRRLGVRHPKDYVYSP